MSASGAGGGRVRDLFRRAADAGSLGTVIFRGMGAILLAFATSLASGIFTIADLIIQPTQTLIGGVSGLIGSVFDGAILVIDTSAITTALSLGPGGQFAVGPFTLALGAGSILLALYAIQAYRAEPETSNVFAGLGFDIPTPGFLGPEEDNEGE